MAIEIGTQLGSHEITGLLGKGGMGEVFRARDTKLKREVAIKILPEQFTRDSDRVTRFQREAEVLASLNHPNIAAIHNFDEAGGVRFLVLELVEGETLADRLERGAIPIDESLAIAKQICEGLEAAHEKGIVHRDLKPANVKITPDGKVKVLDFGLAKTFESEVSNPALSNSPTFIGAGTNAGMILGTAAYMSPEQAKGFPADQRSDVFAFGCVLYQMLTGKPAFEGDTVSEIIAAVLKSEPDFNRLPVNLTRRMRELLERALAKNLRRRWQAIGDVRIEIELAMSSVEAVSERPSPARNSRLPWIAAGVATLAFVALAVTYFRQTPPPTPQEMRVEIATPPTPAPLDFALSPDGHYIVSVASGDGSPRLWLRALDKTDSQPLPGTEGATMPFWSADSRSVGFFAASKLKRIDITGGAPQTLTNTSIALGGTWSRDGTIVFAGSVGPLSRISASGGDVFPATRLDGPGQAQHRFPQFLPDGRHFIYYSIGTAESLGIYLGSIDGGESKRVVSASTNGAYLAPDMILYMRESNLMAQHFDLKRFEVTGDPQRVAESVGSTGGAWGGFSASSNGNVAYRGGGGALRQLTWYDRTGKVMGVAIDQDPGTMLYPELSPDDTRVALQRSIQGNTDIWLFDLVRRGMTRFTFDPAIDLGPVWSPDGMRIAFASSRKGPYDLFVKLASGGGSEDVLLENKNNKYALEWSKDGRFLLYSEATSANGRDLLALPLTGNDRMPISVAQTRFEELNGQFSPDGRWVAYETNESGRFEIVVQPFPSATGKWQISTGGGSQPRWRPDSKELYFVSPDGKLMAAAVQASGSSFVPDAPVPLFRVSLATGLGANKDQYAVSRDGRFLLNQATEASANTPITLILNWKAK
jgi:serine/threonine protein kinase